MKHYIQPANPCEQDYTDERVEELNDEIDEYLEAQEDDKRLND